MKKIFIYGMLLVCACLLGYIWLPKEKEQAIENISLNEGNEQEEKKEEKQEESHLFVDIKGEIYNPGVYEVTEKERVKDVIEKSGGLKENADTTYINLSKKVQDEMVIFIYSKEETKQIKDNNIEIKNSYVYKNNYALITY